MVLLLRRPSGSFIDETIRSQSAAPFTYDAVGWTTRRDAPAGFAVNAWSEVIGRGRDDFERARGLVTEAYRPELVAQQDAVQKAGPVDNDYWVTNSAVLSASGDRAQMLLLMQGQRGSGEKQRLITATVRAGFEKSAAGQWQVSSITVLARPNATGRGS